VHASRIAYLPVEISRYNGAERACKRQVHA